jgi:DNA-binding MarR family transcriptional regulator
MLDRKKHVEELIEGAQFLRRSLSGVSRPEDAGITGSQWLVVGHVFKSGGCTTNEAAAALNMTGSAVTQLVNGLVAKGYIEREQSSTDRRVHRLALSSQSTKRIAEFKKKRIQVMLKVFKALSDQEFTQYLALNKKIINALPKKIL